MPKVSFPCSQIGLYSGPPSSCLELRWTVKWVVTPFLAAAIINIVDTVGQCVQLVFPQSMLEGFAGPGLTNEASVLSVLRL